MRILAILLAVLYALLFAQLLQSCDPPAKAAEPVPTGVYVFLHRGW